jgi:3-hydroxyisobutyrate dehydrogenase-like beta-hydroxyacid dehydrogenase
MANLGYIGLGGMGGRMAARLLDKGCRVVGSGTRSKAQWLLDRGITRFPDEELLAAGAPFVTVGGTLPTLRDAKSTPHREAVELIAAAAHDQAPIPGRVGE